MFCPLSLSLSQLFDLSRIESVGRPVCLTSGAFVCAIVNLMDFSRAPTAANTGGNMLIRTNCSTGKSVRVAPAPPPRVAREYDARRLGGEPVGLDCPYFVFAIRLETFLCLPSPELTCAPTCAPPPPIRCNSRHFNGQLLRHHRVVRPSSWARESFAYRSEAIFLASRVQKPQS